MTQEVRNEVEQLLRSGQREGAIEYLRSSFNISASDATTLVEALEREIDPTPQPDQRQEQIRASPDESLRHEVAQLLQGRRKMEAIKLVRQYRQIGLKEALVMVENVEREVNPNYVSFSPGGCLRAVAKGVGVFLVVVSLIFFAAAAIIYFVQSRSIANSDRVSGRVTKMLSNDTGQTAPVIEYEWHGNKRSYESTFYSSPPDYREGQGVFIFVNRDDPQDVTIDTFADRWALIVGLGIFGGAILAVAIVFIYFSRRKF